MNPYKSPIEEFFQRIANLQYSLFHINDVLYKSYWETSKKILDLKDDDTNLYGMFSRLVISDITGPTDNGWEYNYATGFKKAVWFETLKSEIDTIISKESGFIIAQAHEAFETFLKSQLSIAFYHNKFISQIEEFKKVDTKTLESCTEYIRMKIRPGTNNKLYFKVLREICPVYINMEKHNNLGYNLYNLYYVIAEIRHASTHSDLVIKKSRLNKFTKEQLSILQGFKIANEIDKGSEIVLNKIKADFIVKRLTEIGFTIFKAFSMQYHEDWKDLLKNY